MEKINTEELISSLFIIGFDKVDLILFTHTLAKLSLDNRKEKNFVFEDNAFSDIFNEYITYDNDTYQVRDDLDLNTLVMAGNKTIPLRKILHTNKKLIAYLSLLDFSEIILKKITILSDKNIKDLSNHFCDKEKEIISKIFGINAMYQNRAINQAIAYERIYDEEASELDKFDLDGSVLDKIIMRNEEIDKICTDFDYINWLKRFVKRHGDFCFDDWLNEREDLTDDDLVNVSKLGMLYDAIEEYAAEKRINAILNGDGNGYSYSIKINDYGFNIGFFAGQGTIFYCENTDDLDDAIDFEDIVKYNNKRKTKIKKKSI